MASSFEKSVKGGTKIKLAPPKSKYVEHILVATHAGDAGVAEIFRALQSRLRDSTWTVVFKSLIIIHLMIREGEPDVTLKFLSQSPSRKLAISNFTEVQTQGRNIRTYSEYLLERARAYGATRVDYVRGGEGRLKKLTIDKGLLRETEAVQDQIKALVKCELLSDEPENEITLVAFRLLTMDLLVLFHIMNEGTINVLEHYFEMSHPDAERALNIYRTFCKQTELVVQYLSNARLHEHSTRLEIPKIKHAPTSLARSLEEYLNAPDFETSRRQYLAAKDAKRSTKAANGSNDPPRTSVPLKVEGKSTSQAKPSIVAPPRQEVKPAPDLIDFFESIEQNQQPMAQIGFQPQHDPMIQLPHQTGYSNPNAAPTHQQIGLQLAGNSMPQHMNAIQPNNPFGSPQIQQHTQPGFSDVNAGAYIHQPQQVFGTQLASISPTPQTHGVEYSPDTAAPSFPGQSTNPFRQSMMPSQLTGLNAPLATSSGRLPTNPFARNNTVAQQTIPAGPPQPLIGDMSVQASQPASFAQSNLQQTTLQPNATGTNPFARNPSPKHGSPSLASPQRAGLMVNSTGTTNPFRQSMFMSQDSGQVWSSNQGTIGGLEQLQTVPVFPRPGQQQVPHQEHSQQQGWQ